MIGQTIAHYKILEKLGEGGMGVVYEAHDTKLNRTVALKFLPDRVNKDEAAKARFMQEAQAAAALNHPNICTIYGIEEHDGHLFISMEYIEGGTLREKLPFPKTDDALTIAVQVGEALQDAHSKGIVHRDIKADNVMLNAKGQAKVMDFGLARLKGSLKLTRTSSTVGTLGYMAPEQIGGGDVDHRSDIFSFGVLLFEMLTGRLPFRGDHEAAMVYSIVNEEPESIQAHVPQASPELGRILEKALEKDPNDRYQSVNEMVIDVRRLKKQSTKLSSTYSVQRDVSQLREHSAPVGSERVTSSQTTSVQISKNKLWIGLGAIGLIAAGLILYKFLGSDESKRISSGPLQATFTKLTDQPGGEFFPDYSPDGNFFVYAKNAGGHSDIFLERVGGGNPINLTKDSKEDNSEPSFSPDGQWIVFRSEREGGGMFVMGSTGESVKRLTDFGYNAVWSPDGKNIVCATHNISNPAGRNGSSQLWEIDAKTGEKRLIFKGDAVQPACSPHGARIAYWGLPLGTGQRDIWTIPSAGGEPVAVTNDDAVDWNPVWSPDGKYLYFSSDRGGSMNLWRIPIDEQSGKVLGEPEPITTPSPWAGQINLSRDGRRIVYVSLDAKSNIDKIAFDPVKEKTEGVPIPVTQGSRQIGATVDPSPDGQFLVYTNVGKQEDLFAIRNDGTGIRQLTDDIYKDRGARWSPDGKRIIFYSNRNGRYELWSINPDGSGLQQLTKTTGESPTTPLWFPDGKHILFKLGSCYILDLGTPLDQQKPQPIAPLGNNNELLSISSVSPNGKLLAGHRTQLNNTPIPGVLSYSLDDQKYQVLTDSGSNPIWLNDNRRLLYTLGDKIYLVDSQTKKFHLVMTPDANTQLRQITISRDNRMIYFINSSNESDIWQATLK